MSTSSGIGFVLIFKPLRAIDLAVDCGHTRKYYILLIILYTIYWSLLFAFNPNENINVVN